MEISGNSQAHCSHTMTMDLSCFECLRLSLLLVLFGFCRVFGEVDLTVDIEAGQTECFYEVTTKETSLEIEYQVLDGGDMDISFYVQTPDGNILAAEMKKSESMHKLEAKLPGEYKMCFDNSFSRFSSKVVYFEFSTGEQDENDVEDWDDVKDGMQELVDITLEYFKDRMDSVRKNLDKSMQMQTMMRMHEARDRNIVENNFERVNVWSGIQLFIMISVALAQVLMIRNLFDDSSKVSKTKVQT